MDRSFCFQSVPGFSTVKVNMMVKMCFDIFHHTSLSRFQLCYILSEQFSSHITQQFSNQIINSNQTCTITCFATYFDLSFTYICQDLDFNCRKQQCRLWLERSPEFQIGEYLMVTRDNTEREDIERNTFIK